MGQYENDKIMFNVKIGIVMFALFGPNILIFVWISTFLLFHVEAYFSLSFYPIDFKPWNTDPEVLGRCAMTFPSHTS